MTEPYDPGPGYPQQPAPYTGPPPAPSYQPAPPSYPPPGAPPAYPPPPGAPPSYPPPTSYDPYPTPALNPGPYGYPNAYGPAPAGPDPYAWAATAPSRRRRWWIIGAVVAAVAVAVAVTVVAVNDNNSSGDEQNYYPASGGVLYTSEAAHFQAQMPNGTPITNTVPIAISSIQLTVRTFTEETPAPFLVEEFDSSRAFDPAEVSQVLESGLGSAIGVSGAKSSNRKSTTFQGHDAQQVDLNQDGHTLTFLMFASTSQRFYLLAAPKGPSFRTLSGSFVTLK